MIYDRCLCLGGEGGGEAGWNEWEALGGGVGASDAKNGNQKKQTKASNKNQETIQDARSKISYTSGVTIRLPNSVHKAIIDR